MDAPDSGVSVPSHVQSFMAKVKQFIESTGGKVVFSKMVPGALPIYHHAASGAVLGIQDTRLKEYVHGRFSSS